MSNTTESAAGSDNTNLEALLATSHRGGRRRRWIWLVLLLILVAAAYLYLNNPQRQSAQGPQYLTENAARGELTVTVSATGNLAPTNMVDLGSELSGTIAAVFVDDDDRVTRGQVLAELDLSKYEDAAERARAAVRVAEAGHRLAQATVLETRVRLDRYRELARLSGGSVPSHVEMETAEAELARAEANVASALANIEEARASLRSNLTDLDKGRIRSPIDGVILERAVDPGQTVAASLQAVTLFRVAEDLSQMELRVEVDEADVGQVHTGQHARFSVDAWPGRHFEAVITRVSYNATDTDGVISYAAVLEVDNSDLSLRPGMTATAEITTLSLHDALLVPNAALRYVPPATTSSTSADRNVIGMLMPRRPSSRQDRPRSPESDVDGMQTVWVLQQGEAVPMQVKAGATDGRHTEITGGDLQPGMAVIVETQVNR